MDSLFKTDKAAMIINGDWSLGEYKKLMGDNLGVAHIPKVSATGIWPAPYTSGKFFMISKDLAGRQARRREGLHQLSRPTRTTSSTW